MKNLLRRVVPPIMMDGLRMARHSLAHKKTHDPVSDVPWTPAYQEYRRGFVENALSDERLIATFREGGQLPPRYAVGIDERAVEYPWVFANLNVGTERVMDAGSTLNYEYLLEHPAIQGKTLDILTLAPEPDCFWKRKISYLYTDLRSIPIRDSYYDTVVCISTLEHVGCENSMFSGEAGHDEKRLDDFVLAVNEMYRVLKRKGTLLLTVPYGRYRDYGLLQQFDEALLARAIDACGETASVSTRFFKYTSIGWNVATSSECSDAVFVDWVFDFWRGDAAAHPQVEQDLAVAARAVACVRIEKR